MKSSICSVLGGTEVSADIANVNRLAFASSLISEDLIRLSSLSNSKSQCVITKCNVMSYNTKLWGANMGL